MGPAALQQKMFEVYVWVTLDKNQTMTLTSGTLMYSCTHLVNYLYQLSVHWLQ